MRKEGPGAPPTDGSSESVDSLLRAVARAPARPPPSGEADPTQLAHFRIERRLGAGGMGIVFRATDEKLKRSVALKVLPTAFDADPERSRRFLREARSAAAITHPNVATIYEVGEADGHVFIAMELVEGVTLRKRMLEGDFSVGACLHVGKEIAKGLARAHERGIVHRDLKPENVMLTEKDEVKILDFGLAKFFEGDAGHRSTLLDGETEDQLTQEGGVVGTPAYMAPEQAMGEEVDARADVFSFGVLLFELMTRTRPFQGATSLAVMMSVGRDTPRPPSELNPESPAELDKILLRCLAKDRDGRYASGTELLRALDAVQGGATASLSGSTTAHPVHRSGSGEQTSGSGSRVGGSLGRTIAAGFVLAAAAALGVRALGSRGASPSSGAGSSASTSSMTEEVGATRATVVDLLDHPAPKTKSPEAAAAYRRALTDLRDGVRAPQQALQRAVALDPEMAAAHLRFSIAVLPPASTQEYGEALRARENLDDRDQAILKAEAPVGAGVPPDLLEGEKRYAALSDANPADVEILLRLATLRSRRDPVSARATFARLLELAPSMAGAELAAGDNERAADDADAAKRHYQRCVELSPMATRCLSRLAFLEAVAGQCDAYARDVTHILRLESEESHFRRDALAATLSSGAGPDDVQTALANVLLVESPSTARYDRAQLEGEVALWAGRMDDARAAFQRAEVLARNPGLSGGLPLTTGQRLTIAKELGDERDLKATVHEYLGARGTSTPEDAIDVDGVVLETMREHHLLPEAEVMKLRDRWRADVGGDSPALAWLNYEAGIAVTEGEATAALATGADARISRDRLDVNAKLGHVLLLAGRFSEAAARLSRVAFNCALFQDEESFVRMIAPAAYELGLALEGLGDREAACRTHRRVLGLWGGATPRSKTVELARSRVLALRCTEGARP